MCALLSGLYIGGDHEGGVLPKKEKNVSFTKKMNVAKKDLFLGTFLKLTIFFYY